MLESALGFGVTQLTCRQTHRELVYRPLQFHKRRQLFIGSPNEPPSVDAVRVHHPDHSRFPIFGGFVQRYTERYDEANREPSVKFSEKTRGFFQRWSVKFTAEYYDAKERQDAAKGAASA